MGGGDDERGSWKSARGLEACSLVVSGGSGASNRNKNVICQAISLPIFERTNKFEEDVAEQLSQLTGGQMLSLAAKLEAQSRLTASS